MCFSDSIISCEFVPLDALGIKERSLRHNKHQIQWLLCGSSWDHLYVLCLTDNKIQVVISGRMMEETPNSSMHINSTTFNSSRAKPAKNVLQSLEIEKLCLDFLHKCKYRKRPPQSLRVTGCNGLPFKQKVEMISKIENEVLLLAIKNKQEEINRLQERYTNHRNKSTMKGLNKI